MISLKKLFHKEEKPEGIPLAYKIVARIYTSPEIRKHIGKDVGVSYEWDNGGWDNGPLGHLFQIGEFDYVWVGQNDFGEVCIGIESTNGRKRKKLYGELQRILSGVGHDFECGLCTAGAPFYTMVGGEQQISDKRLKKEILPCKVTLVDKSSFKLDPEKPFEEMVHRDVTPLIIEYAAKLDTKTGSLTSH